MSDTLLELESLLAELPVAVDQQSLGDQLNKASIALSNATQQARRLQAVLRISAIVDFEQVPEQAEMVKLARQTARDVAESLEHATDSNALRAAVWDYEKELTPALNSLDRAVRQQWRRVVDEQFQPIIGVGDLLSRLDRDTGLGAKLENCGRRARDLNTPAAQDLLRQIEALMTDLEALRLECATTLGGEVGDFLSALAEGRATLAMITPNVHRWLTENGVLDRFSVASL